MKLYLDLYFDVEGRIFPDIKTMQVKTRELKIKLPKDVFAYRFYEVGEEGKKENFSRLVFIGKEISIKNLEKRYPEHSAMIDFLKKFPENKIVQISNGRLKRVRKNDIIVTHA